MNFSSRVITFTFERMGSSPHYALLQIIWWPLLTENNCEMFDEKISPKYSSPQETLFCNWQVFVKFNAFPNKQQTVYLVFF